MIIIIKGFRTIVFIFIVISRTFRPICPPVMYCYSPAVKIEPTNLQVIASLEAERTNAYNTKHLNPVMANGIRTGDPVDSIRDVVPRSMKVPEFDKHLKKAGGHISAMSNTTRFILCQEVSESCSFKPQIYYYLWFLTLRVPEFDKHLKKAGGHIDRNVVEITLCK